MMQYVRFINCISRICTVCPRICFWDVFIRLSCSHNGRTGLKLNPKRGTQRRRISSTSLPLRIRTYSTYCSTRKDLSKESVQTVLRNHRGRWGEGEESMEKAPGTVKR
jgi:hypothetical protein